MGGSRSTIVNLKVLRVCASCVAVASIHRFAALGLGHRAILKVCILQLSRTRSATGLGTMTRPQQPPDSATPPDSVDLFGGPILLVKPVRALKPYISSYRFTRVTGRQWDADVRIVPNSCMSLYLCVRDTRCRGRLNGRTVTSRAGIIGAHRLGSDELVITDVCSAAADIVTVNFTPTGFSELFAMPSRLFSRAVTDPIEALPREFGTVVDRIDLADTVEQRAAVLNRYFAGCLNSTERRSESANRVRRLLRQIHASRGLLAMEQLTKVCGLSPRTLRSHFQDCVGMPPKQCLKAARFGCLLSELTQAVGPVDWQRVIPRYQYYDQSHLISEFRSATSLTPESFMRARPPRVLNYLLLQRAR